MSPMPAMPAPDTTAAAAAAGAAWLLLGSCPVGMTAARSLLLLLDTGNAAESDRSCATLATWLTQLLQSMVWSTQGRHGSLE